MSNSPNSICANCGSEVLWKETLHCDIKRAEWRKAGTKTLRKSDMQGAGKRAATHFPTAFRMFRQRSLLLIFIAFAFRCSCTTNISSVQMLRRRYSWSWVIPSTDLSRHHLQRSATHIFRRSHIVTYAWKCGCVPPSETSALISYGKQWSVIHATEWSIEARLRVLAAAFSIFTITRCATPHRKEIRNLNLHGCLPE